MGAVRLVGWWVAGQVSHIVRVGVRLEDRIAQLCGVPADVAGHSGVDIEGGLCERFGVDHYGDAIHGALTDARMCARVLPAPARQGLTASASI